MTAFICSHKVGHVWSTLHSVGHAAITAPGWTFHYEINYCEIGNISKEGNLMNLKMVSKNIFHRLPYLLHDVHNMWKKGFCLKQLVILIKLFTKGNKLYSINTHLYNIKLIYLLQTLWFISRKTSVVMRIKIYKGWQVRKPKGKLLKEV